ncbi:uncharacterized protein LOC144621791 [Crassostrea virginica]
MDSATNMTTFVTFLFFLVVGLMIGGSCGEHSLDRRANVAKRSDNDTYYNIYTKINTLEKYVSNLETKLQKRTKLLQKLLRSVVEIDGNIGLPEKSPKKNAVGFTTKLHQATYSSTSSNIRGSTILYNGGNAYNGTVFTCPKPGLYLFHVSLLTRTKYGGIWIYKNSQKLTIAYAGNVDPQYNGASVSAAVWLDVGDQVYLRAHTSPMLVDNNSVFTGVRVN